MTNKQTDMSTISTDPVYIHTAIAYTNGPPHVGHAYEFITADMISRFNRLCGRDVYYCSGTDEHGQKVQQSAEAAGRTPQAHCDFWAEKFEELQKSIRAYPDFFIRTTMPEHFETVQMIWRKCQENGDIYLSRYEGWYDLRNETFVKESDAALTEYKDPVTGIPYEKKSEETFFFRLSKYQDAILEWLKIPESVRPEQYRTEIVAFIESGLEDICVSRTNFSWGVPVPDHPDHVMYVWIDALNNYMTNLGYKDNGERYIKHWTQGKGHRNACIIGKDIVRFHAVIWPAILMSAGIPLTDYHLVTHGFVSAADGVKMSKSVGNIIDPNAVIAEYGLDSFRHYMCAASPYGGDFRFSVDALKDMNNGILADVVGNLFNRAANLTKKYCNGAIPQVDISDLIEANDVPFDVLGLVQNADDAMKDFHLNSYCELIATAARAANKWLADKAPWKMTEETERNKVIRVINESCFVLHFFFEPTCPVAIEKFRENTYPAEILEGRTLLNLTAYTNLPAGTVIQVAGIIFPKLVEPKGDVKQTFEEAKEAKRVKQADRARQQLEARSKKVVKANAAAATPPAEQVTVLEE